MRFVPFLFFIVLIIKSVTCYADLDTVLLNFYIDKGNSKMLSQPDSGIYYGKKVLSISEKEGVDIGILAAHNIIGMSHWVKGELNKGATHLQEMIKLAKQLKDTIDLASAYGNLGILYIDMGDLDMGLQHSKVAVDLYKGMGEEASIALYSNNIGWIYEEKKLYDSALLYYNNAKAWYDVNDSTNRWYGMLLSNIGSVYIGLGNAKKGLEYSKKGLQKFNDSTNKKALGHIYLNLSEAMLANNMHRDAINHANLALKIAEHYSIYTLYPDAHWFLYQTYRDAGNTEDALKHFELHKVWTDTMLNNETYNQLTRAKTALATEKKDKEIAIKEKELAVSESKRQKNLFYLILTILAAIFSTITGYQLYKRQKLRIKNKELKNKELQRELDFKQQELLSYTLSMTQKNQMLQELNDEVEGLVNNGHGPEVRKIRNSINAAMGSEENWEEFRLRFEQIHHSFFENLKRDFPQLSPNDLRLSAFVKLNLSSKQVASLLNIAPSSVDMSKYRLKKKLGLGKDDNISDIINKY